MSVAIGMTLIVEALIDLREKFDSKLISKCPATIFARRRTANVIGRIICLIASISTMKFIRAVGVPKGVRCVIVFWVKLVIALIMVATHNVRLYDSVIEMWAVGVKLNGRMATRFTIRTL